MSFSSLKHAERASSMQLDLAGIAVCLLLSAAAYVVGVRPLLAVREERASRAESLRSAIEQANSLVSSTRGLRTQLTSLQTSLAKIEIPLQPATSINLRIADLTTLAGDCRVEVQAIQPGTMSNSARFAQIPIQIAATGSYRNTADFLHRLRERFPDTAVRSFELSASPENETAPASFNLQLTWYVQPAASVRSRNE